jgi:hypothetical protein
LGTYLRWSGIVLHLGTTFLPSSQTSVPPYLPVLSSNGLRAGLSWNPSAANAGPNNQAELRGSALMLRLSRLFRLTVYGNVYLRVTTVPSDVMTTTNRLLSSAKGRLKAAMHNESSQSASSRLDESRVRPVHSPSWTVQMNVTRCVLLPQTYVEL